MGTLTESSDQALLTQASTTGNGRSMVRIDDIWMRSLELPDPTKLRNKSSNLTMETNVLSEGHQLSNGFYTMGTNSMNLEEDEEIQAPVEQESSTDSDGTDGST